MCSLGSMYSYTEQEPEIPGSLAPEIKHRESRFESPLRAGLCIKIRIEIKKFGTGSLWHEPKIKLCG